MCRRRLAWRAVLLAATVGLALSLAPTRAYASPILNPHPTCTGSLVSPGGYDWKINGFLMGTLYVYYSSASGGTNCAWFQKNYQRGRDTYTYMDIRLCGATPSSPCVVKDDDYDDFMYYAGPVNAYGTAGRCISSYVRIEDSDHYFGPFHCG